MARTVSRLVADQPFADLVISLSPSGDIIQIPVAAETVKATAIAAGEYSWRTQSASLPYKFAGAASGLIFRLGQQDDYQEAFGSARAGDAVGAPVGFPQTLVTASTVAGSAVTLTVMSSVNFAVGQFLTVDTVASGVQEFAEITAIGSGTSITVNKLVNAHTANFPIAAGLFTTPGPRIGRPPFTGLSQLTPQTVAPGKGINFQQLNVIIAINATAITVPTVGMYVAQFVNGVAPTITAIIPQATNNLPTAAAAQPYVIPVPVPVANQGFIVTRDTVVSVELDFTTGASGSVDVLGFELYGQYNYN